MTAREQALEAALQSAMHVTHANRPDWEPLWFKAARAALAMPREARVPMFADVDARGGAPRSDRDLAGLIAESCNCAIYGPPAVCTCGLCGTTPAEAATLRADNARLREALGQWLFLDAKDECAEVELATARKAARAALAKVQP